jgi:hypothetical protein
MAGANDRPAEETSSMTMIWRGRGVLVPVIAVGAAFIAAVLCAPLQAVHPDVATEVAFPLWGFMAAAGIWFLARKSEGPEPRVLVNQSTGEAVAVSQEAGSLLMVPTRYWAFAAAGAGVLLGVITMIA